MVVQPSLLRKVSLVGDSFWNTWLWFNLKHMIMKHVLVNMSTLTYSTDHELDEFKVVDRVWQMWCIGCRATLIVDSGRLPFESVTRLFNSYPVFCLLSQQYCMHAAEKMDAKCFSFWDFFPCICGKKDDSWPVEWSGEKSPAVYLINAIATCSLFSGTQGYILMLSCLHQPNNTF